MTRELIEQLFKDVEIEVISIGYGGGDFLIRTNANRIDLIQALETLGLNDYELIEGELGWNFYIWTVYIQRLIEKVD